MAIRIESYGETNVGRKRAHNEDNLLVFDEHQLYVVADGMGGHGHGEVASEMLVDTMRAYYERAAGDEDATWPARPERGRTRAENMLSAGIKYGNYLIWERGHADPKYKNMGTTVVALHFDEGEATVAWVGDSRVYRLRDGELEQLTMDHSLLNDYIKAGAGMTPEEIANFPHKNIIVRACGLKESVEVDLERQAPQAGDVYMLCSDGLNGELEDDQIRHIMASHDDLQAMVKELLDEACEHGGRDNITAIAARVVST